MFTTTDDPQKGGEAVDVQHQGNVMFREDAYLDKSSGYRLRDYFYRTIRQRIRNLGLGAFLIPGSGMGESQHPDPGPGIRDEQPGSYFLDFK